MFSRARFGLVLAFGLAGCPGAARREVVSLAASVDAYRRADGLSRGARAQALVGLGCSDAQVCEAKRACVAAIIPTTRALELKDEVARRLADIEARRLAPDAPEAQALPAKLDEAERLLHQGRTYMTACETKLAELRVYYGV